ncbi:Ankyrin repeat protein [Apiospora saccharicola]|uniref:Ankyrin repeat protein n=1 Tax=Apiospora saccharicola TaxID=335842 RepID=A0ABR1W4L1_9PEZI
MHSLPTLPNEAFDLIIEQLVISIGIKKAVRLRTVSRAFDSAILQAICVTRVVGMNDLDTPYLAKEMSPALRGKIIEVKSRRFITTADNEQSCEAVVFRANQALDRLLGEDDQELRRRRHESIAGAVQLVYGLNPRDPNHMGGEDGDAIYAAQVEAQNLLRGAVIAGSLPLVKSLLKQQNDKTPSSPVGVKGTTPYFPML